MTTEATGPREDTAVRLARMATAVAQRRPRATRTGPLAFYERDKSAVGRTAIAAAFPHSRLIGREDELLELMRCDFKPRSPGPRRSAPGKTTSSQVGSAKTYLAKYFADREPVFVRGGRP